jgi:nicotinamidase-related amidase
MNHVILFAKVESFINTKRKRLTMRILAEDTMAIVIDYQEKLVPVMSDKELLIHNTDILIRGLNILQIPMILTQQYTKGIGMTVEEIRKAYGETFVYHDKVSFSCCEDEDILAEIKKYKKKNIIIFGIEAHICVLQTVIDCLADKYNVIVIEDCISSRRINDKRVAIQRALAEGAIISTYESILFELVGKAGSDTFKSISKLIK